jgi:protein TonB
MAPAPDKLTGRVFGRDGFVTTSNMQVNDAIPRASFHVVPPPPPRQRAWTRELAIAVAFAVLLNLLVLLSFFFVRPEGAPPTQEPPAIEVEIVQQREAEKQQEQPAPEPTPQPEPQPEQQQSFTRSGATDERTTPGYGEEEDAPADMAVTEPSAEPEPPQPEVKAQEQVEIPGWARTLEPGYDVRAGQQGAAQSSEEASRARGGDAYLNAMGQRIVANVAYPAEARGATGVMVVTLIVNRTGTLEGARMIRSTGNAALDRAGMEAISRSMPFTPFPPGVTMPRASFELTLRIAPS